MNTFELSAFYTVVGASAIGVVALVVAGVVVLYKLVNDIGR